MNDLLKSYLGRIEKSVNDLRKSLEHSREAMTTQQEAQERLLKQYWSRGKELAQLGESVKDYERLRDENLRLRNVQQELQVRTRQVLEYAKALSEEFRR